MGVMENEWYAKAGQPAVGSNEHLALVQPTIDAIADLALEDTDLYVIVATPGAEAADAIEVACAIQDVNGSAIASSQEVFIRSLAVTADKGDISAAGTPVGTLVKAVNPATGENVATMTTTAGGLFSFKISNDAAEVTHIQIVAEGCRPKILKLTFAA